MPSIVADTGPINYLVLIGQVEILPQLFAKVLLPGAVNRELSDPGTPIAVRNWAARPPAWIEVRQTTMALGRSTSGLGSGEAEAINLAVELNLDALLMDDRQGVSIAVQQGLIVTGTMGILARAAGTGLLDLAEAFERLKRTNFRYRQETMDAILKATGAG